MKHMGTPSEELVEIITPLLVDGGLLLAEDAMKHKAKFVAGTMTAEDWFLAAEKAAQKGASK